MSLEEPTFIKYTVNQAKTYSEQRTSYSPILYDLVLSHHVSTGGKFELLLDLGCGPGNVTRDLAKMFNRAIGLDPSHSMVDIANGIGARDNLSFCVGPAEACDEIDGIEPGSVDLITAAMSVRIF